MLLGYIVIWVTINLGSTAQHYDLNVAQILWLLAILIFDIINVTIRRLLTGRNPLFASRDHLHHFFQVLGLSQRQTLIIMLLLTIGTNAIGLVGYYSEIAQPVLFYAFALLFVFASLIYQLFWTKLSARAYS
jgi:UDP-GlcNAc:undecaprenyl-phosphate GlcNAc-1-phosphate transferase